MSALLAGCGGGGGQTAPTPTPAPVPAPAPAPVPPPEPPAPPPATSDIVPTVRLRIEGDPLPGTPRTVRATASRALQTATLWYDRGRGELVAGVVQTDGTTAVLGLSPVTLATLWSVSTSSVPLVLAASDSGAMLYAGLADGSVQQVDLRTRSAVRRFDVAPGQPGTFAFSISVRPGSDDTVAVATGSLGLEGIPSFSQLAVWEAGVPWSVLYWSGVGGYLERAASVTFQDASTLIAFDNETTGYAISRFGVGAGELTVPTEVAARLNCCFDARLSMFAGQPMTSSGAFLDPSTLRPSRFVQALGRNVVGLADTGVLVDAYIELMGTPTEFVVTLTEHESDRLHVRRRVTLKEPFIGTSLGRLPRVQALADAGAERIAVALMDDSTGLVTLATVDFASLGAPDTVVPVVNTVSGEGVTVRSVALPAKAIAYDAARDRIVALLGSQAGTWGNSLVVVNPSDGGVERRVSLTSEPFGLVVSATGSLAYVALPNERAVQQIDVSAASGPGWKVAYPGVVQSMAVDPADPQALMVVDTDQSALTLLRSGRLAATLPLERFLSIGELAFAGPGDLYGIDTLTTSFWMSRFSTAGGVLRLVATSQSPLQDLGSPFGATGDTFYSPYRSGSFSTLQQSTTILRPEGAHNWYDGLALVDANSGWGYIDTMMPAMTIDRLAVNGTSGGFPLLTGTRRLQITDTRIASMDVVHAGRLLPMAGRRLAIRGTPTWAGGGTIYIVDGL
jgi:hypothetical protein